jgi:hypothetical protein
VRPPDRNSDARGHVLFDAAAASIRPSAPLPGRHPTRVAAPSTTSTITTTSTSASKGYHLHVVLAGFYSSHSIRVITTLQLQGDVSSSDSTFDLFSSLTVCGAPAVTAGGVRLYLVGYILCIIDCHICWDIFGPSPNRSRETSWLVLGADMKPAAAAARVCIPALDSSRARPSGPAGAGHRPGVDQDTWRCVLATG